MFWSFILGDTFAFFICAQRALLEMTDRPYVLLVVQPGMQQAVYKESTLKPVLSLWLKKKFFLIPEKIF